MSAAAKLPAKLCALASCEVGTEEVNGSNCGPRVDQYKATTNLPPHEPWPWCAAFICWLVKKAMAESGIEETDTFTRPRTASAWDFVNWSLAQDGSTLTRRTPGSDIMPGDIVVFTFSHIGLATSVPNGNVVETIEGNTDARGSREGGGVYRKTRSLSKIKARIRFTI